MLGGPHHIRSSLGSDRLPISVAAPLFIDDSQCFCGKFSADGNVFLTAGQGEN